MGILPMSITGVPPVTKGHFAGRPLIVEASSGRPMQGRMPVLRDLPRRVAIHDPCHSVEDRPQHVNGVFHLIRLARQHFFEGPRFLRPGDQDHQASSRQQDRMRQGDPILVASSMTYTTVARSWCRRSRRSSGKSEPVCPSPPMPRTMRSNSGTSPFPRPKTSRIVRS